MRTLKYLIILGVLWISGVATATEEIPALGLNGDAYPLINTPTQIMISHASYPDLSRFKVTVTYRANSSTSHEEVLSAPNADGYVSWTPQEAGIAILKATAPALNAGEEEVTINKSVSVRFGGFPPTGILIFALATLILFGGLGLFIFLNSKPFVTNPS